MSRRAQAGNEVTPVDAPAKSGAGKPHGEADPHVAVRARVARVPAHAGYGQRLSPAVRIAPGWPCLPIHDVKQRSFFVPAARCCARVRLTYRAPRRTEGDGAPRGAKSRAARAKRGGIPPDALASRRSTVALLRSGAALLASRHCLRRRRASPPRPGRSARRATSRTSGAGGYEPPPRDATPCSALGPSPEDAPR